MTGSKYVDFATVVATQVPTNTQIANTCRDHLRLSLAWTARHLEAGASKECEILLKGSYGAAVEAVSLVSFGLIRPAILSLRSHYELNLQYLFYKDHPIEWRNVLAFRAQPNLPGVNKKFLRENYSLFEERLKKLSAVRARSNEDCYGVLSGVAHGTAINSISTATEPKELVEAQEAVAQSVGVFLDVGENISDIHVACFESNWLSLPELTRANIVGRFGDKIPKSELRL